MNGFLINPIHRRQPEPTWHNHLQQLCPPQTSAQQPERTRQTPQHSMAPTHNLSYQSTPRTTYISCPPAPSYQPTPTNIYTTPFERHSIPPSNIHRLLNETVTSPRRPHLPQFSRATHTVQQSPLSPHRHSMRSFSTSNSIPPPLTPPYTLPSPLLSGSTTEDNAKRYLRRPKRKKTNSKALSYQQS